MVIWAEFVSFFNTLYDFGCVVCILSHRNFSDFHHVGDNWFRKSNDTLNCLFPSSVDFTADNTYFFRPHTNWATLASPSPCRKQLNLMLASSACSFNDRKVAESNWRASKYVIYFLRTTVSTLRSNQCHMLPAFNLNKSKIPNEIKMKLEFS